MSESVEEMPLEARVELLEISVQEYQEQLVKAAMAINRAEFYIFSLIKCLKDSGTLSIEELEFARELLRQFDSVKTFWAADLSKVNKEGEA